jgi:two-component sensor histidine kinase
MNLEAADDSAASGTSPGAAGPRPKWRARRWEAADLVIAVAGALVALILGIFVMLSVQGYGASVTAAKSRAEAAAGLVAVQANALVRSSITALRLIESRLALEPADFPAESRAEMDAAIAALPFPAQLAVYDVEGNVEANGAAPSLPATIAGLPYFEALVQGGDWTIAPHIGSNGTGTPQFVIAKRLGTDLFAGVAVLAIPGTVFDDFWAPLELGEGSTVSVLRADGWIIGRHPVLPEAISLAGQPAFAQLTDGPSGSYTSDSSPVDGVARVIGYRQMPELGLIAQASISRDTMMTGLWSAITTVAWLLIPISLALIAGSVLTAHLLRKSSRTQRSLSTALEHNDVLFREIHHRVKNNLQSVASLLQMQPIPREIKANMGQRIAAMSAVHEHIYRSNSFDKVSVKGYLQTLIASIRAGQTTDVELIEDLDDLLVDKDAATPLGLIVNEVVSNAFKHAFPDGIHGRVAIHLHRDDDTGHALLVVEDNGVGFDPDQPAKGIGRRLIAALTQQLGGDSHTGAVETGGSRFMLRFPIAS